MNYCSAAFICSGSAKVHLTKHQWRIQTKRLGGNQIRGRQKGLHLLKYQRSATIVGYHTWLVTFCRPNSGYISWSNYAIFQGITTVWKRFISLI